MLFEDKFENLLQAFRQKIMLQRTIMVFTKMILSLNTGFLKHSIAGATKSLLVV